MDESQRCGGLDGWQGGCRLEEELLLLPVGFLLLLCSYPHLMFILAGGAGALPQAPIAHAAGPGGPFALSQGNISHYL